MKHSQKIKYIMFICIIMVIIFSGAVLIRSIRPSQGSPYEKLTWEEAQEYMAFEGEYYILDVSGSTQEADDSDPHHIYIAYDELLDRIEQYVPQPGSVIYIASKNTANDSKAAMKLCHIGYTGVAVVTGKTES